MATAEERFAARIESLAIAKEDAKRLEVALGATSAKEADERLEQLGKVALREMVQWLLSVRRFASVSELDGARVLALFLEIRRAYPTVDQLVDELGISSSRAVALLGRLKYGEGKALARLARVAAVDEIQRRLDAQSADGDGRKSLLLTQPSYDEVEAADFAIMSEPQLHRKGERFAGAEAASFGSRGRQGGTVRASETMWGYILEVIKGKIA
jgi:hypothetical protein